MRSIAFVLIVAPLMLTRSFADADEVARAIPAPAIDSANASSAGADTAVLAGGCYWGMQGLFEHAKGVRQVIAGYSGGHHGGGSGDSLLLKSETTPAESVEIKFDPSQISYGRILQIYFSVAHDPTQLDRQGPDHGPQYRSVIFYADGDQRRIAESYIKQLSMTNVFSAPILTQTEHFQRFVPAKSPEQDVMLTHPQMPYVVTYDLPKLADFKRLYPDLYRKQAAPLSE